MAADPEQPPPGGRARVRRAGRRTAAAARATAQATQHAASATGRVTTRASRATGRRVRRATTAEGAGESGLSKVIEAHAVSAAGDALVLLSLASTVFFAVPVGQARGRVALYLLVTMLPFSVLAPVVGPLLDRFGHGRRYAIAVTMVVRAFLAWVMASAVAGGHEALSLYPAAFGHLVCSKAYTVLRAAAVPRVLPAQQQLVKANARVMLGGVVAVAAATPVGAGLMRLTGPQWSLRLGFAVFVLGTGLALALPRRVDSARGEVAARLASRSEVGGRTGLGPHVVVALRAIGGVRAFTGFLTFFLAFALRTEPLSDSLPPLAVVGFVAAAAGVGNAVGTSLGAVLRRVRPEVVVIAMVALAAAGAALGALAYALVPVLVAGLCAGLASALGKLALDSTVQRDVPDAVRTSAFARSETVLQVAWVLGGGLGIALPLGGAWGLGVAALGLVVALVVTVRCVVRLRAPVGRPAA